MDFRCSNSATGMAILCGGLAFTLLLPERSVADPLEFSAPLVPLAVPHPSKKIKDDDNDKPVSIHDNSTPFLDNSGFVPSGGIVITQSKHHDDPWSLDQVKDSNPNTEEQAFLRSFGSESAWFSAVLNSGTNSAPGKKPANPWDRDENNSNSLLRRNDRNDFLSPGETRRGDSMASRFSMDNQTDGDRKDLRDTDRLSRYTQENDRSESSLSRVLGRDSGRDSGSDSASSAYDRFGYSRIGSDKGEADASAFSVGSEHIGHNPGVAALIGNAVGSDSETPNMPFGTGTYIPPPAARSMDDNMSRSIPGYSQMQDPTVAPRWAIHSSSRASESRYSRPSTERPTVLVMPKHPGDP